MSLVVTDDNHYKAIADAIRNGAPAGHHMKTLYFKPSEMPAAVVLACSENEDAGYWKGHGDGEKFGYSDGFQEGYDDGFTVGEQSGLVEGIEQGKQAEYDRFWDAYQQNGNRTAYGYAFSRWSDECYNPKYPITAAESCSNIYQWSTITDTMVDIVISASVVSLFDRCTALLTVKKIQLLASTDFTNWFRSCGNLVNLSIEGIIDKTGLDLQYSKLLSKTSIESVVNALSTTTSGLSITLSKTAVNAAFTDAEWSALAGTKTNWNINLV